MTIALSLVEAAQDLLCDGVPKLRVGKELDLSRVTIEKIAAGTHVLQTDPRNFLDRYSRRPQLPHTTICPHSHPLETVEKIEALLCHYLREQYDRSSRRRFSLLSIAKEIGVGLRAVNAVARRCHPAQLARDGKPQRHFRSERLPSGAFAHTKETVEIVGRMLADGDYSQNSISMVLGMTARTVRKITRSVHFQQVGPVGQAIRTQHMRLREETKGCYLPSPRKIGRICEQIQKTWTAEEAESRYCGRRFWKPEPVSVAC